MVVVVDAAVVVGATVDVVVVDVVVVEVVDVVTGSVAVTVVESTDGAGAVAPLAAPPEHDDSSRPSAARAGTVALRIEGTT